MIHVFKKKDMSQPVWVLLHGTGGDEQDLIPLAEMIDPKMSILSIRGNVKEGTMNRYFKRLSMGVFDLDDLAKQTRILRDFIIEASHTYQFDAQNIIVLGYSNGANIAANALLQYEDIAKAAVLMHPMIPTDIYDHRPSSTRILITAGKNDPICPPEQSFGLKQLLESKQMSVDLVWYASGHQITSQEVSDIQSWIQKQTG